jgi:hypothetical protein
VFFGIYKYIYLSSFLIREILLEKFAISLEVLDNSSKILFDGFSDFIPLISKVDFTKSTIQIILVIFSFFNSSFLKFLV